MKVILLAPRAAGKTSLLAGAYGFFASRASDKYDLKIDNYESRAVLEGYVNDLVSLPGAQRFSGILGNDVITPYEARFAWKRQVSGVEQPDPSFQLQIVDVPGKDFSQLDAKTAMPDRAGRVADLRKEVQQADVFVVAAPFDLVYQQGKVDYFKDLQLGLGQIRSTLLDEYKRRKATLTAERPMNIVIALTRSDRLDGLIQPSLEKPEILKVLREHARNFAASAFEGMLTQSDIQFYMVATSLGEGIEGTGKFNPINVELPFVYASWRGLLQAAWRLEEKREAHLVEADRCEAEAPRKRAAAATADSEASSSRSAASAAKEKWGTDWATGNSKRHNRDADNAESRASSLRSESSQLLAKAKSERDLAKAAVVQRQQTLILASDLAERVRASLGENCYIVRSGHYMRCPTGAAPSAELFLEPEMAVGQSSVAIG